MHATTYGADFRAALANLKRVTGRAMMPAAALAAITVASTGTVTIRRTNAATEVTAQLGTSGEVTPGSVTVDAQALADAIGSTKGPITLSVPFGAADALTVTTDAGTSSVRIAPNAAHFPAADAHEYGEHVATVTAVEAARLASVLKASGNGDARAVLASVAITANGNGSGEAVATDTYRMHATQLERVSGTATDTYILPADVAALAAKSGKFGIHVYRTHEGKRFAITFGTDAGPKAAKRGTFFRVTGYFVEGPYPNYRSLIPDADSALARWTVADASGTADVLAAFRNTENAPAILTPSGSAVAVSAAFRDGTKRDAIAPMHPDGDAIGPDASIAFNPAYFADALRHAGNGATVRLRDGLKAAVIEGEHAYALLMPMRVS
jgi:DNA polymerase III sliding clamp (beta) subunit (PCNA family)